MVHSPTGTGMMSGIPLIYSQFASEADFINHYDLEKTPGDIVGPLEVYTSCQAVLVIARDENLQKYSSLLQSSHEEAYKRLKEVMFG